MDTHDTAAGAANAPVKHIPLHELHIEHGAKMVPFAGHAMPLNYREGILAEHRWCRASAALFDVSHMGQLLVSGAEAGMALESLIPADLIGLAEGQARYCLLTNEGAGIRDDLIITRTAEGFHVVVNAARREDDLEYLRTTIGGQCRIEPLPGQCLLALQGPSAARVLERAGAAVYDLYFMRSREVTLAGTACRVIRSGYTGEDGVELSVDASGALALARALLADSEVRLAGLGARDSLRLEAGLCLYGHDLDMTTTPVEADLAWTISKARRPGGSRAGGYPGADVVAQELERGPRRKRVGLLPEGRTIVRGEAALFSDGDDEIGVVTSGGFSPTLEGPIAMGYIAAGRIGPGAIVTRVRGRETELKTTRLPFVPHRYFRKA
ncbi:MAG: glycine cleavage system aminomethyltransferase GcvT [Burkholderiales bacterium]